MMCFFLCAMLYSLRQVHAFNMFTVTFAFVSIQTAIFRRRIHKVSHKPHDFLNVVYRRRTREAL